MTNKIYKTYVEKTGGTAAESYIGNQGEMFLDPNTSAIRVSDGIVPGGQVASVQSVQSLVDEKRAIHENALAAWKNMIAQEYPWPGHPWFSWNVTGENANEYLAELINIWAVQVAPSSPPSSPPTPNQNLIANPPISAAYYNQIRAVLSFVIGSYENYVLALQAKEIVGASLTVPTVLYTELDEDLIVTIRYTSLASGGANIINERQFKFSTNGTLTFPNGTVQYGAAFSKQELQGIVAQATDFAQFKALIGSL